MAKITLFFSVLLIALGLVGYLGTPVDSDAAAATNQASEVAGDDTAEDSSTTDSAKKPKKRSITALIPSFFGVVLLLFGLMGLKENLRMHAMHGAAMIGLLGFLAAGYQVFKKLSSALDPEAVINWRSFGFIAAMTLICAAFVGFCVHSFIQARRERKEAEMLAMRSASGGDE